MPILCGRRTQLYSLLWFCLFRDSLTTKQPTFDVKMLTGLRNLVPRAPFPGSKAREKSPGDEVHDSEALGSKLQIFCNSIVSQFPGETCAQRKQNQMSKNDQKASRSCQNFDILNVGYYETCYNNRRTQKQVIAKWLQISCLIGIIPITETLWGGGFQVTGIIEWRQKSKPKKILRASNKTPKNPWTKIQPPKMQ